MKNLYFYLHLFAFLLVLGVAKASANTYSNTPQYLSCGALNMIDAKDLPPLNLSLSDDTDKTWRIITKEDTDKTITLHLSQRLVFLIYSDIWTDLSHFTSEIASPNLLKETLGGDLLSIKGGDKIHQVMIFQPLLSGQTALNIMQNKDGFWKKSYAKFTVNIVE